MTSLVTGPDTCVLNVSIKDSNDNYVSNRNVFRWGCVPVSFKKTGTNHKSMTEM